MASKKQLRKRIKECEARVAALEARSQYQGYPYYSSTSIWSVVPRVKEIETPYTLDYKAPQSTAG